MTDLPATADRLILVRHALPEVVDGLRARDWPLSDEGRRRCGPLAEALRQHAPSETVYSSDEPKAVETACLIGTALGLPTAVDAGLAEHRRGSARLLAETEWQAAIGRLFAHPKRLEFGEETGDQARRRFEAAVHRILSSRRAQGRACICVAHGTVISLYVAALTGADGHALWKRLAMPSFVVLERGAGRWALGASFSADRPD